MTASAEFTLEQIRRLLIAGLSANTELPAATLLADAMANPTAPAVASHLMVWNGATWDRAWVGSNGRILVDTELRDAGSLGDDVADVVAPKTGSHLHGYDGALGKFNLLRASIAQGLEVDVTRVQGIVNTELPPAGSLIDAMGLPISVLVGGVGYAYNGDNVDRVRNNHQVTALESAARIATATSVSLTNYNAKGIAIYLNVTAVGAPAGTITQVEVLGVIDGTEVVLYTFDIVDLAAVGTRHLLLYPGAATAGNWSLAPVQGVLPREFRIRATHLDASSITYSVTVDFIN